MRYALTLSYDGSGFYGWQIQPNERSIQETLQQALGTLLGCEIAVTGAGRTDTDVNALEYIAHFDYVGVLPYECVDFIFKLNAILPQEICILDLREVDSDFHARFDAKKRTYLYRIQNTAFPPVLNKNRVWHVNQKLDIKKMNQAAQMLIGKHDFSTFRAANCQAKSPIKTLDSLIVKRVGEEVRITVSAKSFLYHQVRNFAGALVKVGLNRWSLDDFEKAFRACDRTKGAETAPAQGLYFMKVEY
jgi:tRNA pseudouridine38-40 synthase